MKLIYNGTWVDKDKNRNTGIDGREAIFIGNESSAKDGVYPDPCADAPKVKVAVRDTLWINGDCFDEQELWELSGLLQGVDALQGFSDGHQRPRDPDQLDHERNAAGAQHARRRRRRRRRPDLG